MKNRAAGDGIMRIAIVVAAVLCAATAAMADNWPQFRGPTGLGYTTEKNLPIAWGGEKGENVLWKSPLVGDGHASPIVWGDHVFVSTVRWEGGKPDPKVIPEHHLVCYAVADGKKLWDTTIEPGPWRRDDFRSGAGGGYAAPTPATDGKHVYVISSSSVIASVDFEGKIAWRQEIKPHTFDVTIGASPVLFGDTVILLCAMAKPADSRLVAFAKSDGTIKWETKLPTVKYGHSTPLLLEIKGKQQLVILTGGGEAKDAFQGFDPVDGRKIWWCKGSGESSSPAYGAGILYGDSGRGGNGFAVDPNGEGDLGATNVKWTVGVPSESLGSPIIVGEHVYRLQGS